MRKILERYRSGIELDKDDIIRLLGEEDFSPVYEEANSIRCRAVGDIVHLRAIIEFSNICKRQCRYCGLNRDNKDLKRFRMTEAEILETAKTAVNAGYKTIVLQSGEDKYFDSDRLGHIVAKIKEMEVAVTLSCGELAEKDLKYLREVGADRYLLKHETADSELYSKLHPCGTLEERIDCLMTIHRLGYETGGGFMVGLPGQSLETIAEDLLLLKEIPCDMAGIGPFISNPKTELCGEKNGDTELTKRAVAIARLLLPEANLPVTTALTILAGDRREGEVYRENPFEFGANVVMKKVTPDEYKQAYEIYPAEFKRTEIAKDRQELEQLIRSYGRVPK